MFQVVILPINSCLLPAPFAVSYGVSIMKIPSIALFLFTYCIGHSSGSEYAVYPANRKDELACAITTNFLNELLFSGNVQACTIDSIKATQFWLVQAEENDLPVLRSQPGVSSGMP